MCKFHGVRLIKGIKILKVCLSKTTVVFKQNKLGPVFRFKLILLCCNKILGAKNAG